MVVAPDADLAAELVADASDEIKAAFATYLVQVQNSTEIERQATDLPELLRDAGAFVRRQELVARLAVVGGKGVGVAHGST